MLSDDAKRTIDALSKDELRQEINKKNRSRFQGDNYAYLQTRLASLEEQDRQAQRQEDAAHKGKELFLNRMSVWVAVATSILSLLVGGGWYITLEISSDRRLPIAITTSFIQTRGSSLSNNCSSIEKRPIQSLPFDTRTSSCILTLIDRKLRPNQSLQGTRNKPERNVGRRDPGMFRDALI